MVESFRDRILVRTFIKPFRVKLVSGPKGKYLLTMLDKLPYPPLRDLKVKGLRKQGMLWLCIISEAPSENFRDLFYFS